MNPYLTFGLAMCGITLLALAGTAYMAVYFNRRAKADLEAAFQPLAETISGSLDIEEAEIKGRYAGHIAEAAIVNGPAGAGRFFKTRIIDGAGGTGWSWLARIPKQPGEPREASFESGPEPLQETLRPRLTQLTEALLTKPGWIRLEYDPQAGHVQFTRPMQTRRDLPPESTFRSLLDDLVGLGALNRSLQQPEAPAQSAADGVGEA